MGKLQKKIITSILFLICLVIIYFASVGYIKLVWLSNVLGVSGLLTALIAAIYFKGLFPGIDKRGYNNPNNKEWE